MPLMPRSDLPVDIARRRSVSFAPSEGLARVPRRPGGEGQPVPVGPGRAARVISTLVRGAPESQVSGFTVHPAKVQRPPLRGETLARDRLLDWLHVQIHHRVVLVMADAGYGKTTLLADFSGRTRLRTLWYRLDEDDRDWMTFLRHLVAAGREHDPEFAPRTAAMLSDVDVAGPTRDTVIDSFVRELPTIAEGGAVLVLDDFHLVDEAPDVKLIARALVAHGPERLTIVFSSRRAPGIPLAKLRAGGEVAELRTDDLRFDTDETARLFAETYGRPLEPDVLADLSARTEGWAASLQLVQAALRDRSPTEIRRIVRNLTGADRELYDYLAEEVVGDLPEELQLFLMRTSILQAVTPELAALVTDLALDRIRRLMTQAERLGLLSRRGQTNRDSLRYHPLVRDFLEARLSRAMNPPETVEALHRRVAASADGKDWRLASHHYLAAGDVESVARVIDESIEDILAKGDTVAAEAYLTGMPEELERSTAEVIRSRSELRRGRPDKALSHAIAARSADPSSAVALTNLSSVALSTGAPELIVASAGELAKLSPGTDLRHIGQSLVGLVEASLDANVRELLSQLHDLLRHQRARGHVHYEGVTLLNIAVTYQAQGDATSALRAADESLLLLETGGRTNEVAAARDVRGWALAHRGDLDLARAESSRALGEPNEMSRVEALVEAAEVETWYGSDERASSLLGGAQTLLDRHPWIADQFGLVEAQLAIRTGRYDQARERLEQFEVGLPSYLMCFKARLLATRAHIAVVSGEKNALSLAEAAASHAREQDAWFWAAFCEAIIAVATGTAAVNQYLLRTHADPAYVSIHAELFASLLPALQSRALDVVRHEAQRRSERWLPALRAAVDEGGASALPAAELLELIGSREDVTRLRSLARSLPKGPTRNVGRRLARRIAPRVFIEDQGRIAIKIGDSYVEGTAVRRKVLAMLCYLLTRPRFSATRDEVLDALWPDADPRVALNSLNQTVYFLRRVLEPDYDEDTSPGYVRHESDVVWLDRQLVTSRSQVCADLMRSLPTAPSPADIGRLAQLYSGPYALDFMYEDWATAYRDSLHASYLQIVEHAVSRDLATGHFDRGISLARRALEIDPAAEQMEVSLLRLLRMSGAHAAASEQYEHYATVLRDTLGVEAPPLDAL